MVRLKMGADFVRVVAAAADTKYRELVAAWVLVSRNQASPMTEIAGRIPPTSAAFEPQLAGLAFAAASFAASS